MEHKDRDLLTVEELAAFERLPEGELVNLAAELDMAVGESFDRAQLLDQAVVGIAQLARTQGLPLSSYDRTDLEELPREQLVALASMCGTQPTVDALLKAGAKVYKVYRRSRPQSPIAMFVPMFLAPLARYALSTE